MIPQLVIIGAGGFGREVYCWASDMIAAGANLEIKGFIDDNPNALEGTNITAPILGEIDKYEPAANDRFVCGIGSTDTKLKLCRSLQDRGGQFASVIHPSAVVAQGSRIGRGVVVCPPAMISTNVTLEDFVAVNASSSVGHDAFVGCGATLSCHCDITGGVTLGEGVFLASHVSIVPGKRVGANTHVGAGSVVIRNLPTGIVAMGSPAKRLFEREQSAA